MIHSVSTVEELIERNEALKEENDSLFAENYDLNEEIERLKQELSDYEQQLEDMTELKNEIADERDIANDNCCSAEQKYENDMDLAHTGQMDTISDLHDLLDFIEENHEEVYFTIMMNTNIGGNNCTIDEYDKCRGWQDRHTLAKSIMEGKGYRGK